MSSLLSSIKIFVSVRIGFVINQKKKSRGIMKQMIWLVIDCNILVKLGCFAFRKLHSPKQYRLL